MELEVKVYNDGKGKWQSYEAYLVLDEYKEIFREYGETEQEALDNLYNKLSDLKMRLSSLDRGDFKRVNREGKKL